MTEFVSRDVDDSGIVAHGCKSLLQNSQNTTEPIK